jgi:hypothetical protein
VRRSRITIHDATAVLRILASISLLAFLAACATEVKTQEQCTVQYPPGPCSSGPSQVPQGK